MADVVIRDADLADLDAIMRLETETFETDAWSRDMMAAELASPNTQYFVAMSGDVLVGYAGLSAPAGSEQADIQTIAVDPNHRRFGIGRVLLRQLLALAQSSGVADVLLEVRADNPGAQRLCELNGFTAIAVRPRYYQPDDVDAIVMRCEVET